jgi:peptidoglycan/LPS O-acetylase OafA/YrhL
MTVDLDKTYWLGLLVSVVLPVLVGLVTTRVTHAGVKAVLLLALSTANGFLVEYAGPHGDDYSVQTAAVLALVSFAIGVLTHFGLLKPTGISGKAQDSLIRSGSHAAGT